MTLEGRDISEWQGVLPPEWFAQWDFVIIRAFNEHGVPDQAFSQNWENARGRTRRGAYGWPVAGGPNAGLARNLHNVAPDAEAGWWADYEHSGAGLASVGELEEYVRELESFGGLSGFYSNLAELPRTAYLDSRPWWFANPSGNPEPRPALITQYGIIDGVDANRADHLAPAPPPPPPPFTMKEGEMLTAIQTKDGNLQLFGVDVNGQAWQNFVTTEGQWFGWHHVPTAENNPTFK